MLRSMLVVMSLAGSLLCAPRESGCTPHAASHAVDHDACARGEAYRDARSRSALVCDLRLSGLRWRLDVRFRGPMAFEVRVQADRTGRGVALDLGIRGSRRVWR